MLRPIAIDKNNIVVAGKPIRTNKDNIKAIIPLNIIQPHPGNGLNDKEKKISKKPSSNKITPIKIAKVARPAIGKKEIANPEAIKSKPERSFIHRFG